MPPYDGAVAQRNLGRCLVTGAGGFIGSHLVEELCHAGADVRALVRYSSDARRGWLEELDPVLSGQVEVVFGDVRDPDQMRGFAEGCDTVFHLAALIGIPYSYASPRQNLETNALGTLNLLEAARRADVGRFVHTSTSEVYGSAQYLPIDERHPQVAQSPYAASKIAADQMTASFVRAFGLPAVTVRPFNTYGPRQSMRAVIPTIIAQALWSNRIRLGSLQPVRDFVYVGDTVAGMVAVARTGGLEGETLNLGRGEAVSIEELVAIVCRLVGTALPVETEGVRLRPDASEVDQLLSDPSRATELTGWRAERSLEAGIAATIEWIGDRGAPSSVSEFAV